MMEMSEPSVEAGTAGQPSRNPPPNDGNNGNTKKNNVRKRTKTGCMTCRKRRIKCDEGKPRCNNCRKSKRMCEGYNRRVVFKDPMGFGGPFQGPPIVFPGLQDPHNHPFFVHRGAQHKLVTSQGPLPTIAPKPTPLDFQGLPAGNYGMTYHSPAPPHSGQFSHSPVHYEQPPNSAISAPGSAGFAGMEFWSPEGQQYGFNSPLPRHPSDTGSFAVAGPSTGGSGGGLHIDGHHNSMHIKLEGLSSSLPQSQTQGPPHPMGGTPIVATPNQPNQPNQPIVPVHAQAAVDMDYDESDDYESMDEDDEDYGYTPDHISSDRRALGMMVGRKLEQDGHDAFGIRQRTFGCSEDNILSFYTASPETSPLNDQQTASIFRHFVTVTGPSMSLYERHPFDPSPIFQGQHVPKSSRHIWTYTFPILSFNHPALLHSMLALGGLQMAKYHNIPPTTSLKHYHLALRKVKKTIRGVSRRTHASTLAATMLLGYFEVWSSDHEKWCKHLLGSRLIVKEIPFPEMTRAYLAARKAKRRKIEEEASRRCQLQQMRMSNNPFAGYDEEFVPEQELHHLQEADRRFVCELAGRRRLAFEKPGRDRGHGQGRAEEEKDEEVEEEYDGILNYTDTDLESYEQLADLFWWYCKMDTYQSILSGTKPFMDYNLWTQVLPRAPMGRIDAIYGTFDHLVLLLGRVASFVAKDVSRKRKCMTARGGPGMRPPGPPPGSQGGGGPHAYQHQRPHPQHPGPGASAGRGDLPFGGGSSGSRGPVSSSGPSQPSPPSFPGMLPRRPVEMPTGLGFSPPREPSPQSDDTEGMDLEAATAAANAEWQAIREAFSKFQAQLPDDFQSLDPEYHHEAGAGAGGSAGSTRASPFGPARNYRTFSIAGIWMNLYMGLIVLYRAHPTMPPVAMMAAGMMARDTSEYAAEIGRISTGLSDDVSGTSSVATIVAAAFIESSFCLFVAGIQYRDMDQRHWLIRRMHDISRLTGWQSARQIAEGCESAWSKAAEFGRGPPYRSPEDLSFVAEPSSVWVNNPRRIDRAIRAHNSTAGGGGSGHGSHDRDGGFGGAEGVGGRGGGAGMGVTVEQRLILHKSEQAHYAMGLLSMEQDLERLDLQDGSL